MLETYDSAQEKGSLVLRRVPPMVHSAVAVVLAALLALPPMAAAQTPNTPSQAAPQPPNLAPLPVRSLAVYVLEGQDAVHDIRDLVAAMVLVEVRDENGLPLQSADVTFTLPPTGPGGFFANRQLSYTTKTNFQGQAVANYLPNMQTGRFNVRVTATIGNRTGQAVIRQSNARRSGVAEPKHGILKFAWWKVAVLAGAGAGIGILVARRGGSGSSVTLIPGSPTFGAP